MIRCAESDCTFWGSKMICSVKVTFPFGRSCLQTPIWNGCFLSQPWRTPNLDRNSWNSQGWGVHRPWILTRSPKRSKPGLNYMENCLPSCTFSVSNFRLRFCVSRSKASHCCFCFWISWLRAHSKCSFLRRSLLCKLGMSGATLNHEGSYWDLPSVLVEKLILLISNFPVTCPKSNRPASSYRLRLNQRPCGYVSISTNLDSPLIRNRSNIVYSRPFRHCQAAASWFNSCCFWSSARCLSRAISSAVFGGDSHGSTTLNRNRWVGVAVGHQHQDGEIAMYVNLGMGQNWVPQKLD